MPLGKQNWKYCIAWHTANKQLVIGLYNIGKKQRMQKPIFKTNLTPIPTKKEKSKSLR